MNGLEQEGEIGLTFFVWRSRCQDRKMLDHVEKFRRRRYTHQETQCSEELGYGGITML